MAKNDAALYEELGRKVYESYTKGVFAKVLKTDTDAQVFHIFLLMNLEQSKISEGNIRYDAVGKNDIFKLSLASGLTEGVVQSKLETDFYIYGKVGTDNRFDIQKFITNQLKSTRQGGGSLVKEGKIRLLVANPVVRKQLVNALAEQGSVPDYSFNRDILSIGVLDVLDIMDMNDGKMNNSLFDALQDYIGTSDNDKEKEELKTCKGKDVKETLSHIASYMGKTAYEKFLDAAFAKMFNLQ